VRAKYARDLRFGILEARAIHRALQRIGKGHLLIKGKGYDSDLVWGTICRVLPKLTRDKFLIDDQGDTLKISRNPYPRTVIPAGTTLKPPRR
jgi:hypothetical protein